MSELACARVLISGRVQGIGFRYFVSSTASNFAVKGYVRNLDTGDVELEVEGDKKEVYNFLMAVREGPRHGKVERLQTEWKPFEQQYDNFFVKY